jgi:peroxiredoxin
MLRTRITRLSLVPETTMMSLLLPRTVTWPLSAVLLAGTVVLGAMRISLAGQESATTSPAIDELIALAAEYEKRRDAYWEAARKAETTEQETRANTLNPDDELIPKFLELEERHRGSDAGLDALCFIVNTGADYLGPGVVVPRARVTACERLAEYYVNHPDVDACFGSFFFIRYPEAELLLRRLAEHSQIKHVRAAAWFHLAQWLKEKANLPMYRDELNKVLDSSPENQKTWLRVQLESWQAFGDVAVEQTRADAVKAANHVRENFADQRCPTRGSTGPARVLLTRDEAGRKWPTYGERAAALLFEIEHLAIGAVVPEITGTDADGVTFRLSDYRGRVVILMFSADWCGPCKGLYPGNRQLLHRFCDKPFAILSVMADDHVESVQKAHEDGEITWRTWWDGYHGPIAMQWNILQWPTIFVIDHRGVIRYRDCIREELTNAVTELLQKQADDPEAEDLLEAHPVSQIPTLMRAQKAAEKTDKWPE